MTHVLTIVDRSQLGHIHDAHKLPSLTSRARFPLRTVVTVIKEHKHPAMVAAILTRAWDWAVETNTNDIAHRLTPLKPGPQAAFVFSYLGYTVEISVVPNQSILLTDIMQILASTHDQMAAGLGLGSANLNVYNAQVLVASGIIKRYTG